MTAAGGKGHPSFLSHREDLDGLRGLAIILVLLEHTAIDGAEYRLPFTPAMAGVTVFFVLSGYLITTLLLREQQIDLRNFYIRRVARLGPALLILLAFVSAYGIATGSDWVPGVLAALAYVNNWAHVLGVTTGLAQHTWTLAIEEQFYLLWPIAMILAPRRWLLWIAATGAVIGCSLYATRAADFYYSTLTNGGALMAGCAAAIAGRRLPRAAGLLGVALIAIGALFWSQPAATIGAVLVVTAPIEALLPIAFVGRRAYSLYLWSWPLVFTLGGLVALPLTVLVAEGSYHLVERPIAARFHARLAPRSVEQRAG